MPENVELEDQRKSLIKEMEALLSPELLEAIQLAEAFGSRSPKVLLTTSTLGTTNADHQ